MPRIQYVCHCRNSIDHWKISNCHSVVEHNLIQSAIVFWPWLSHQYVHVFVWTAGTQASKERGVADENGPIGGAGTEQQQETKKNRTCKGPIVGFIFY